MVEPRRREWEDRMMASIGVPSLYRQHRLSDFRLRANPPSCFQDGALDWSHSGFFLRGSYGQGKSCFAGAMIRAMLHPDAPAGIVERINGNWRFREKSVRWWHSSDLSNWILDESFAGRRKAMYEELLRPRLIVVDDYGKERMQMDVVREAMVVAIEKFTSWGKFLIVTTNIPTDDALAAHEGSISSRLDNLVEIILPPLDRRGAFKGEVGQ